MSDDSSLRDESREALFIVELYATTLNDSLRSDSREREDAFGEVMELINSSALSQETRDAVVRVVLTVLRLTQESRRAAEEERERAAVQKWRRRAKRALVFLSVVFLALATCFRWENAATLAFLCVVGLGAPELGDWLRDIASKRQ